LRAGLAPISNFALCPCAVIERISPLPNKIGARNWACCRSTRVQRAGGGALAGENGARIGQVGFELGRSRRIPRSTQNQALSGVGVGGVASQGVASLAIALENQGLAQGGRQIASFATGAPTSTARGPQAAPTRCAEGGRAPHRGAVRHLYPGSARQGRSAKRIARRAGSIPPQSGLKAFDVRKNREWLTGTQGVGGSAALCCARNLNPKSAGFRENRALGGQKSGRGMTIPAHPGWRKKLARLGSGVNRVN